MNPVFFNVLVAACGLFFVSGLALVVEHRLNVFSLLTPKNAFLAYFLMEFGVFPIVSFGTKVTTFPMFSPSEMLDSIETAHAIYYAIAMVVLLELGYVITAIRAPKAPVAPVHFAERLPMHVSRFGVGLWVLTMALCATGFVGLFKAAGGLAAYADRFVEFRYIGQPLPGFIIYISTTLPGFAGLLMILWWRDRMLKSSLFAIVGIITVVLSLLAIATTGFRVNMVPIMWAAIALYHYRIRRLSAMVIVGIGAACFIALGVLGFARDYFERGEIAVSGNSYLMDDVILPVVLRVPGTEMLRLVRYGMEQNPEHRGLIAPAMESVSIVIPRALWTGKPTPQSLEFGYRFLGEYLFWRNNGELSAFTGGFSPTFPGYAIWLAGDWFCLTAIFAFGAVAGVYHRRLENLVSMSPEMATLFLGIGSQFPKFADAPQDAMNGVVMISITLIAFLVPIYFMRRLADPDDVAIHQRTIVRRPYTTARLRRTSR